jgi:HSP20 family protein
MDLDHVIGQVSQLYRSLTGREIPSSETPYAPIPAEKDPAQHVQEQVDRLLGSLNGGKTGPDAAWAPPITIYESNTEVVVALDTPGTTRDRIDVHLEGGMLVVAGQRTPTPADGQTLRHTEARFGTFRRVVPLAPGLRTMAMVARLEGGVLEVRIPRDAVGDVRRIDVS